MFKLNIECTKDISELHINFTDGTSAVVENTPKSNTPLPKSPRHKKEPELDDVLNADPRFKDYEYKEPVPVISKEKVKLPEIPDVKREVKVANELQNLDFQLIFYLTCSIIQKISIFGENYEKYFGP